MRARRAAALGSGLVLAIASVGCGAIAEQATEEMVEQAIESQGGGQVELDGNDGEMTIETEDGSMTFGSGEVPAIVSDNLDLPSGNVTYASEMSGPEGATATVGLEVDGPGDATAGDLEVALDSGGWDVTSTVTSDGYWAWEATKGDLTASVIVIASEGSPTSVQVVITQPSG